MYPCFQVGTPLFILHLHDAGKLQGVRRGVFLEGLLPLAMHRERHLATVSQSCSVHLKQPKILRQQYHAGDYRTSVQTNVITIVQHI